MLQEGLVKDCAKDVAWKMAWQEQKSIKVYQSESTWHQRSIKVYQRVPFCFFVGRSSMDLCHFARNSCNVTPNGTRSGSVWGHGRVKVNGDSWGVWHCSWMDNLCGKSLASLLRLLRRRPCQIGCIAFWINDTDTLITYYDIHCVAIEFSQMVDLPCFGGPKAPC